MYNYRGLDEGLIVLLVIIWLVLVIGGLVTQILYLLTLQNTLNEVSPENRKMPPGQVWLMFIPLFNIGWQFVIVTNIADSLKAEFQKRNIAVEEERPGYSIGLTTCILICCCIIPFLGLLAALGAIVCWIIYWVKISGYKRMLKESNPVTMQ